jgi:hypothetical protein
MAHSATGTLPETAQQKQEALWLASIEPTLLGMQVIVAWVMQLGSCSEMSAYQKAMATRLAGDTGRARETDHDAIRLGKDGLKVLDTLLVLNLGDDVGLRALLPKDLSNVV